MPRIESLLETALYVDNVPRSARFYERVLDIHALQADVDFAALAVAPRQMLLLFRKGSRGEPAARPGGVIPPHGGDGELHLAFAVAAEELPAWEQHLAAGNIPVESHVTWPRGGRSIYFRDPDGHLVELATPGTWPTY